MPVELQISKSWKSPSPPSPRCLFSYLIVGPLCTERSLNSFFNIIIFLNECSKSNFPLRIANSEASHVLLVTLLQKRPQKTCISLQFDMLAQDLDVAVNSADYLYPQHGKLCFPCRAFSFFGGGATKTSSRISGGLFSRWLSPKQNTKPDTTRESRRLGQTRVDCQNLLLRTNYCHCRRCFLATSRRRWDLRGSGNACAVKLCFTSLPLFIPSAHPWTPKTLKVSRDWKPVSLLLLQVDGTKPTVTRVKLGPVRRLPSTSCKKDRLCNWSTSSSTNLREETR